MKPYSQRDRALLGLLVGGFVIGFLSVLVFCGWIAATTDQWYQELQKPHTRLGAFIIWDHGPIRHYDSLEPTAD